MIIIKIKEYQTLPPSKGKTLTEEESDTVNKLKSLSLVEEDQDLREKLQESNILSISADPIKKEIKIASQSHIGVAQFTNFTITIIPKFSNIGKIVELIDYVYDLDLEIFPESEAQFEGENNLLSEIIISTFVKQCQDLLRKGMVKSYVVHEDNSPYLRGKLLVSKQIINDSKSKLLFASEHDEFEFDNLENQILLFCLERCYYTTINKDRKKEIRRLIQTFEGQVKHGKITLDSFKKINYNQMNNHYQKSHELCKLIVNSMQITNFYEQKTRFVNSFFVDMNRVFEKFVYKLFKEFYPLPSKEQQMRESLIFETENKKFNIKTDILIFDKKRQNIETIIDTKYKEEITQQDCYQLEHYIHDFEMKEAFAILPGTTETFSDTISVKYQDITIQIRHIDIDDTLELLYSKDKESKEKISEMLKEKIPLN